ncbi:MAG TPA: branched-chain amino acid aminotransferase [Propionibacteriaceae bacterium]|nr:branched-chain amino acid aminotransferase [Propionibacteriaceae bacterium]
MPLSFAVPTELSYSSGAEIAAVHAAPGFGTYFTDHMVVVDWTRDQGWHDARVQPYGPFLVDPASAVLHYAQEIFEGLKAYRHADGSVWLFRPEKNAERFARSARRLALPELPVDDFVASIETLVRIDERWVPTGAEQSLYLRPFMIANENFLGVRPAEKVLYSLIASPVGSYFKGGVTPVDIWISTDYTRAAPGGTGAAKCGGNYAASLLPQQQAYEQGCSQVLFLDGREQKWIEELGGMNMFVVTREGRLITPELTGSILEGVTRDSILEVGSELGLQPEERRLSLAELTEGVQSGGITEVFACGTAAVLTPINSFRSTSGELRVPGAPGHYTMEIRQQLLDIQSGRREDTHGWMRRVL